MAVRRIVPNIHADDPVALARFYAEVFDLDLVYDMGWIAFLTREAKQQIEMHTASQGGADTELPAISIEVDNFDETLARLKAHGIEPEYGPVDENWGLRRFYFVDPSGHLINVVTSID